MKKNRFITLIHVSILTILYVLIHVRSLWGIEFSSDEFTALINVAYLKGFPIATLQDFHITDFIIPIQATRMIYYWFLYAWTLLIGFGPLEIRMLSIVFGLFFFWIIYLFGRQLFSNWASFWGVLCLLFTLPTIEHTAIVRFESSYWFFWYLTLFLIVRYGASPNVWVHLLIGSVCGIAIFIHPRAWAAYAQGVCAYIWISKNNDPKRPLILFSLVCCLFLLLDLLLLGPSLIAATAFSTYTPNVIAGARFVEFLKNMICGFLASDYVSVRWGARSVEIFWTVQSLLTVFSVIAILIKREQYAFYFKLLLPTALFIILTTPVAIRMWINLLPYLALAQGVFIQWIFETLRQSGKNLGISGWLMVFCGIGTAWFYDPGIYASAELLLPVMLTGLVALGILARHSSKIALPLTIVFFFFCVISFLPGFLSVWSTPPEANKIAFAIFSLLTAIIYFLKSRGASTMRLGQAAGLLLIILTCRNGYALVTGQGFPNAYSKIGSVQTFLQFPRLVPKKARIISEYGIWWPHRENSFYDWRHQINPEFDTFFKDANTLTSITLQFRPDYLILSSISTEILFNQDTVPSWWLDRFPITANLKQEKQNNMLYTIVHMEWKEPRIAVNPSLKSQRAALKLEKTRS